MLKNQKITIGKLRLLLNFLLNEFFAHIEEDRLSMEQEMRAGSIAWISTFAPELVGGKERIRIREIRNFMHEKEDYSTSYWYKSLRDGKLWA